MEKEKLSFIHIAIGVYMIQSGIIILSLPNVLAEYFGTNGWVAILLGSILVIFNIYLIYLVYSLGSGQSIFNILEQALPKILLYPIYLVLVLFYSLTACLILKQYSILVQILEFPNTSVNYLKIILLILVFLSVTKGIYNLFKIATLFFFLTVWLVLLIPFNLPDFEFIRLTPHLFYGATDFLKGSIEIYAAFLGFELMLFIFPHVDKQTPLFKALILGQCITTFVYWSITFICFGFFSFEQLQNLQYSTMDYLSYIKLPFVERIENLIFAFILFKMTITTAFYYWAATIILKRMFTKIKNQWLTLIIIIGTYIYTLKFRSLFEVERELGQVVPYLFGVAIFLPLLLILILLLKNKKRKSHHAKKM